MLMGSLEEQLRPQLLSGLAYERLLAEIISGRLEPGQRLRLDLLAHSWAVSRTPVREALQRLADMRLVHVSPNAGTRVAAWSNADMIERARIVGALLEGVALAAPTADRGTDREADGAAGDALLPDSSCELTDYLDLAERLISRDLRRLGAHLVRDHIDPLRLFVDRETAHRHGVNLEPGRRQRRELLTAALAALDRRDAVTAGETLAAFSARFVSALAPAPASASAPA